MIGDFDRFNISHPDLCPALRWKGQFIMAEPDPTVPTSADGLFWCLHTQTCIGPDGELAEPGNCSSKSRPCHGTGKCRPSQSKREVSKVEEGESRNSLLKPTRRVSN